MPRPRREAARLAEVYRLRLPHTPRPGVAGERLGRGTGSSLEFQDRRAYVPGDDVRHIDWRAYARTDQLFLRLYREEVLPLAEILVDGSRSMEATPSKARLAVDLAALLAGVSRREGLRVVLRVVGSTLEPIDEDRLAREGIEFPSDRPLHEGIREVEGRLRPGSLRLVVSDFLDPEGAPALVRPLAARAGGLVLLHVLAHEDVDPPGGAALRLIDAESGETLDRLVDGRIHQAYRERLQRVEDALDEECRRVAAMRIRLTTASSLADQCRDRLAREGLLEAT